MGLQWGGSRQPASYGVSTRLVLLRLFLSTVHASVIRKRKLRRYVQARDAIVKQAGHQPIGKTWGILRYPNRPERERNAETP